ncbi:MAG: M23 family metallopeptidase [Pseudomonadota bacterium]
MALAACASSSRTAQDYRTISPRWQIANSPIPIPAPKAKPSLRWVSSKPAAQRTTWVPASTKAPSEYRVRAGDTVYGLARRYGVPAQTIIKRNGLKRPYHLRQGQRLALGAPTQAKPRVVKAAHTPKPAKPQQRRYKVRSGDGLYAVARAQGVPASTIIKANGLKKPYALRSGQTLVIPAVATKRYQGQRAISPHAGKATFIWPASGKIVSSYGVKADGLRNDGINIAAKAGAPVYAAARGEVIYAGDRLRAFGNLILVRHASGMVSAYAHVDKLMVQIGQTVVQGEQIATVGKTGLVSAPQLHFELRRNSAAIDPMRYLGRVQMASAGR